MLINKNYLKNIYLLCFLFFLLSCKNEKSHIQELNNINLPERKDSLNNVNIDTISSNNNVNIDTIPSKKDSIELTPKNIELDSTKQYVYLTFDDGPFKGSKNISRILKEQNIRGTVFLVGANAFTSKLKESVEDYKQNSNVDIGNHTFSHAYNKYKKFYSSPQGVYNDILKNERELGINTKYVRLPARNVWRINGKQKGDLLKDVDATADLLSKNNYYIFGWDCEWSRSINQLESPEKIYKHIVNQLERKRTFEKDNLVILMHDDMFNTEQNAEKLRELIILLKKNPKIVLAGISNYPKINTHIGY